MKWISLCFLLMIGTAQGQNLSREELRAYFLSARSTPKERMVMLNRLERISPKTPIQESYTGISYAYRIQDESSNWSKLKLILKAKTCLNNAVSRAPKDPECHFLRLILEHHLPSFLGLNKHLTEDVNFVFTNRHFVDDVPNIKQLVLEFMLKTNRCNDAQKQIVQTELKFLKENGVNLMSEGKNK